MEIIILFALIPSLGMCVVFILSHLENRMTAEEKNLSDEELIKRFGYDKPKHRVMQNGQLVPVPHAPPMLIFNDLSGETKESKLRRKAYDAYRKTLPH